MSDLVQVDASVCATLTPVSLYFRYVATGISIDPLATQVKWAIAIGIVLVAIVIASQGRIPGTGRQLAVSDETRTAAAIAHTPKYERKEVIARVSDYIRDNCPVADKYLVNLDKFEATWMRQPRVNDHNFRGFREWTVREPITGAFWRLYEDNDEIVEIQSEC